MVVTEGHEQGCCAHPRGILKVVAGTAPGHVPWTAAPLCVFLRFPASGGTQPGMFPVSPNEVTEKNKTVCCCFVPIMFLRSQAQRGSEKRQKFGTEEFGETFKGSGVEWGLLKGPGTGGLAGGNRNRNTQTCVAARGRNRT